MLYATNIGQKFVLPFFLFISVLLSNVVSAQSIASVKVVSRGDENADYAMEMIKLGLEKAGRRFELVVQDDALSAPKMREELLAGNIDVVWMATDMDMEQHALPVRVPLYKGLLGHRLLIIHKDNAHLFDRVQTMEDVRRFTYGQGVGWPDTAIMQANGMKVVPATKYEGLFHMVDGKRFDAFPRGIHEPWGEVQKHTDLELTVDTNIMLVYTMPYYLFVAPNRSELAADIERGLLLAIDDGSFDEKLFSNPMVKMVLKYSNIKNRRIFKLHNPELPPKTPLDNPKLWMDVSKL